MSLHPHSHDEHVTHDEDVHSCTADEVKVDCDCETSQDNQEQSAASQAHDVIDEAERVVDQAASLIEEENELVSAQAEAAAYKDRYLRLHAEWENFRKRTQEDTAEMRVRAAEKLMEDVLPVLDDFERAIEHASSHGEEGLLDGVKAISTKLSGVLEKHGLKEISPEGEAFDALEHSSVAVVDDTEAYDETVAQVYQKGYKLGRKVIRPAMVTITSGGPKRPADKKED